jgi:SAM-dependent methyltransferase
METGCLDLDLTDLRAGVAAYYSGKVRRFGATPFGVDWTCVPTQEMRFVQLMKIFKYGDPFSLNDFGCGYGALLAFLDRRCPASPIDYLGIDLSAAMIRCARRIWCRRPNARFVHGHICGRMASYSVASGVFNVQLSRPRYEWEAFIRESLRELRRTSELGFSVNFVMAPLGGQAVREGLYATHPEPWVDFCTAEFGATTDVVVGYGLREFTLLVRPQGLRAEEPIIQQTARFGKQLLIDAGAGEADEVLGLVKQPSGVSERGSPFNRQRRGPQRDLGSTFG